MYSLNEPGRTAAETEAALKHWIRTNSILHRQNYEAWYCRLGQMAFDSSRPELKSFSALWEMHRLAVDGPVAVIFRFIYRRNRSFAPPVVPPVSS